MGVGYADVVPGQKIEFSARWHNDINRLLNAVNGTGAGAILGGAGTVSRLKVYNSTSENLNFGWAVAFDNKAIVDGAVPAVKYSSNAKAWGVLTETLEPGSFGSVIISGAVEVAFSGSGDYASPNSDGKSFVVGATGAQVLCSKDGRAVILLGGGVASETGYNGYFTLKPLAQTEEELEQDKIRVAVCDGQTWNSERLSSNQSLAYINGVLKYYSSTIVTVSKDTPLIVMRYSFGEDKAEIKAVKELVDSFYTYTDYLIGELVFADNQLKLIQRHITGTLILNCYTNLCLVGDFLSE